MPTPQELAYALLDKGAQWGRGVQGRVASLSPTGASEALSTLPAALAQARTLPGTVPSADQFNAGIGGAMNMMPGAMLGMTLPGIPALKASAWRGGKAPMDGAFYSRDAQYSKGFNKGDYRQYAIDAESALNLNKAYSEKHLQPVMGALSELGEKSAAQQIGKALQEDGGALGGHLYQWLTNLSSRSPEEIFRKAGIDALDTGRDIIVLNKNAVSHK